MVEKIKQEFGLMKWLFAAILTATLCTIISYFNLKIFGSEDGLPYCFAVICIGAGAITNTHYISSKNKAMARAAFIFEIALSSVLIVSASYAISGLRELSLARQVGSDQKETIKDVKEIKSRTAQAELSKAIAAKYSKSEDVQAIFAKYDRPLFYLLIAELGVFGLSMFVMIGIAFLPDHNGDGIPDLFQSKEEIEPFANVDSAERFNGAARPKDH